MKDCGGTLTLNLGEFDGGKLNTKRIADELKEPWCVLQLDDGVTIDMAAHATRVLSDNETRRPNIAGPRESKRPRIHAAVTAALDALEEGHAPLGNEQIWA